MDILNLINLTSVTITAIIYIITINTYLIIKGLKQPTEVTIEIKKPEVKEWIFQI